MNARLVLIATAGLFTAGLGVALGFVTTDDSCV